MTELEITLMVRRIIKQELAPILMGQVISNESSLRSTIQRFSTDAQIPNLRNIQPYGISSKAPAKTEALIIPVASDPTHLNMVGHFDANKPDVDDGETQLYNAYGQAVYLKNGSIHIGEKTAAHPISFGDTVQSYLSSFLNLYINNLPLSAAPGNPISPPSNIIDAVSLKAQVDGGAMNSTKVFIV